MRESVRSHTKKRVWPLIVALLLLLSSLTGFYQLPQWIYYGVLGVLALQVLMMNRGERRFNAPIIIFILISALGLIVNQPPAYFNAWYRLLGFILVVITVGPLVTNDRIGSFRVRLFDSIMILNVALSVGSLICYFLEINFFVRNDELQEIGSGTFSGLYIHSMMLGPMAGISSIYLLVEYLNKEKRKTTILILLLACLISTLLAASRAAIGACILGMVATTMRFYRGRFSKGVIWVLAVLGILAITFPIWGGFTDFVMQKQEASISRGEGFLLTRNEMMLVRIKEIAAHPIWGIGFCCVDPDLSYVNTLTGKIEPGTSWLAVFSMTGIFGFLSFVLLFVRGFRISLAVQEIKQSSLFVGCLAFFFLHLFFEGYVLAAGSILALTFWLLLGCVYSTNVKVK